MGPDVYVKWIDKDDDEFTHSPFNSYTLKSLAMK